MRRAETHRRRQPPCEPVAHGQEPLRMQRRQDDDREPTDEWHDHDCRCRPHGDVHGVPYTLRQPGERQEEDGGGQQQQHEQAVEYTLDDDRRQRRCAADRFTAGEVVAADELARTQWQEVVRHVPYDDHRVQAGSGRFRERTEQVPPPERSEVERCEIGYEGRCEPRVVRFRERVQPLTVVAADEQEEEHRQEACGGGEAQQDPRPPRYGLPAGAFCAGGRVHPVAMSSWLWTFRNALHPSVCCTRSFRT